MVGYIQQVMLPDGERVSLNWMFPEELSPKPASMSKEKLAPGKTHTGNYSPPDVSQEELLQFVAVPEDVPLVVISHGIFQSASDLYEFVKFLTWKCGYVVVVFNRRGNDLPLSRPR